MIMLDSYFPLIIQYQDNMEYVQVDFPHDISSGRNFKVCETNADADSLAIWKKGPPTKLGS